MKNIEKILTQALARKDVMLNGSRSWDPQILDENVFMRIMRDGYLGAGESFMDKQWDVKRLDELIARVHSNDISWEKIFSGGMFMHWLRSNLINRQKGRRAFEVGQEHYDLGNDLYEVMLDKNMVYTCGYWKSAKSLEESQIDKMDLILSKLNIKKNDRLLDIGCGWGSLMKYAVEKYGVTCVGLTVSHEQALYARELCKNLPVEVIVEDYALYGPKEKFDKIVSVEMFEAVGQKNYHSYMKKVRSWLKDDGIFVLQTIESTAKKPIADPWIDKYIFPNGVLPNKEQIQKAAKNFFYDDHWQDIGKDYDPTLMAWWQNFQKNYHRLDLQKYDERFYRMWKYYLQSCAGGFRSGVWKDWQIVFSPK